MNTYIYAGNSSLLVVKDNDLIGVSWGEALAETVNAMEKKDCKGVVCIPLIGGPSGKLASSFHVNTIAYEIASKLNGKSMLIDSPAILESEEIKKALDEVAKQQTDFGIQK